MFRASSCPSSGAYQLQYPPLVYRWNVVVAVLVVVGPVGPTTTNNTATTTARFTLLALFLCHVISMELWSAHVPARLSNFCCRTHFVRRDVTCVSSAFQTLPVVSRNGANTIEKVRQRTFLYDTKSPDSRDQHMRANA
jgi:hypothetical protein